MLKKQTKPAGTFEDEGNTAVKDTPPAAATVGATAAAGTEASTAIAKAASTSVVVAKKFSDVFAGFDGALPAMGYGTLPKLVGTTGAVMAKLNGGKQVDLGEQVGFELVSFRSGWTISPGEDSDDAKPFVAYSDNGVTLDKPDSKAGTPVAEYVEFLRTAEGYEKASSKRYVYLVGILTSVGSKKEDAAELVDKMVEISFAPTAVTDWEGFRAQTSAAVARGKRDVAGAEHFRVVAEKRSGNGKNWTVLVPKA